MAARPRPFTIGSLFLLLLVASGCSNYTLVVYNNSPQPVLARIELPDPGGVTNRLGGAVVSRTLQPRASGVFPFKSRDAVPVAMLWDGGSVAGRLIYTSPLNPGTTRLEVRAGPPGEPLAVTTVP